MSDTQQTPTAGTSLGEAAAALAEIQRREVLVVKAVLVPGWYWWAMAAGLIVIGAARDTGDPVVQAVAITLAALVMAAMTGVMIPAVRRRVQVHRTAQPRARGALAVLGLIVLVDAVIVGTTASLATARFSHPTTIGTAAGAAVIVIVGPLVNRYLGTLMLSQTRQQTNDALRRGGSTG